MRSAFRNPEVVSAVRLVLAVCAAGLGCEPPPSPSGADTESAWSALMDDGDASSIAPASATPPMSAPPPPRFCSGTDCARQPLALWTFDDCNPSSTELADTAFSTGFPHDAFRAVSVACVAGIDNQAVRLASPDDIVYTPDQPDYVFDAGLTVAAWLNPDNVTGTQSIVRKRLDGSSAFLLAIDGKRINFVLRLTNGRVTAVSAPIKAGVFTHVAATFDGQQAILYINGAVAAQARAMGSIATGPGPIFIGNDASGRRFKGSVDTVWLNTLAAPPDVIQGLTCIRKAPVATLSPGTTPPTPAGTPVAFHLGITNPSSASCPADTFEYFGSLPFPLSADNTFGFPSIAPGSTVDVTINVTAQPGSQAGSTSFQYFVADTASFALQTVAQATFVVAPPPPPMITGCPATPGQPVAPGGYWVNGNTVCTADGRAHLFHGVDRPSLEFNNVGSNVTRGDFALMSTWNATAVRIALNQDFWIAGSPLHEANYQSFVDSAVSWAEMAGMDVILDLHWSDAGVLGGCPPSQGCQQLMPDSNSVTFWSQVASRYKGDGRVIFELYNEPHDVPWNVWRDGGRTPAGWQAVGMQTLYDTVRATGAQNLVLIGGLDWAYDLSGVPANRITGYNIMYATHPYTSVDRSLRPPNDWNRAFGFLTATDPVVVTEFGVLNDTSCATDYDSQVIAYADAHFAGWTAWAWFPGGCTFPAVVNDWAGTPSPTGSVVKPALLGYNDPPASPPLPSPGPASAVDFTFDRSVEGWSFNNFNDPSFTNLGAVVPPGATAPTITLSSDGDPTSGPGSAQLAVGFSALNQYIDAEVTDAAPGLNLAGKTLHANVRLVSGSFTGGVQFHASTGPFIFGGQFYGADQFPIGQWVPVTLNLSAVTSAGFDPTQVVQIGVQIFSGFTGGAFNSPGTTVFEIDTVAD